MSLSFRHARHLARPALTLLILLLGVSSARAAEEDGTIVLPPGFTLSIIDGLTLPTDMAFLPDGKLLVLEKGQGEGTAGVG